MVVDAIDFGTGFVNTSDTCKVANLTIQQTTYNDEDDCWVTSDPNPSSAFEIENDGNVNVTLTVTGPHEDDFFDPYPANCTILAGGCLEYNISWKTNDANNACGGSDQATYIHFDGTAQSVCGGEFQWDESGGASDDQLFVDIEVKIPQNLETGEYVNSTIEFEAS
jgi:hypothetical protein